MMERKYFVHPTAVIDEPAEIGEGTQVWHFCHIMSGTKIGDHCILGQNVFVASGAVLGNRIKVQNNVSIFAGVTLEDDVFCGPCMVFTNVFNPRSFISRRKEFRKTLVKRGATLGANATVVCGLTIGQFAFVGAGSVVTSDVPDYVLTYGNPAKAHGWVCQCADPLTFRSGRSLCKACGKRYRKDRLGVRLVEGD
jgi:UDP-2-acetamido-3-amino-2,3-dideoxy-glucuronate N-acetyltransferase